MGRPAYKPSAEDQKRVEALHQVRTPLEEIARQMGMTKKTLIKHFAFELGRNSAETNDRVKTDERVKTPPPFEASVEQREAVEILSASTIVSRDQIADRLSITVAMLEHHFADELKRGATKRHTEVVLATHKNAAAGNVSAQRLWFTLTGAAVLKKPATPKGLPEGKKEQAQRAAEGAGGESSDWDGDLDVPTTTH